MQISRSLLVRILCCAVSAATAAAVPDSAPAEEDSTGVSFQNDIRPLLSDRCFACHGPDEDERQADLRLDQAEAAELVVVAGRPEDSPLIERIFSDDPDLVMPPPETGKPLTDSEKQLLKQWISDGAHYETHWAFRAPERPEVPQPEDIIRAAGSNAVITIEEARQFIQNPIDAFVLRKLVREGLRPSAPADRITLLRRLSLDLTGLPPTIEEADKYAADNSGNALGDTIERLLQSPHFGERWARIWLDAARYADSDGYEKDKPREMWFYRDWVVDAFNRDLPYDRFIIEQLAGDQLTSGNLLPSEAVALGAALPELPESEIARRDRDLFTATGFLRNSMINEEGGADPEQFRMEALFDRMDAIGKSVLGITIQCAQCHSHKYDPLTHRDYYRMFAFLNSTHDAIIPVYTPEEDARRHRILQDVQQLEEELRRSRPDWRQQMVRWEAAARSEPGNWSVPEVTEVPFEGQKFRILEDQSILSESFAPTSSAPSFVLKTNLTKLTGLRLDLLTHPQLPRGGPGRSVRGTAALSEIRIFAAPQNAPDQKQEIRISSAFSDLNPQESPQPEYLVIKNRKGGDQRRVGPIDFAVDGNNDTAWTTDIDPARRNQSWKAVFTFETPIEAGSGFLITVRPAMRHGGSNADDNHNCLMGRYRFSVTDDDVPATDPVPGHIRAVFSIPAGSRTEVQQAALFSHWRTTVTEWAETNQQIDSLYRNYPEGTTQLVLRELETPRETAVLNRGDFLNPAAPVQPGAPDFLHDFPVDSESATRLDFARWLVDRRSPTTARSIVNRIWQACFGIGLVETSDDLGSQSSPPSHPELLDWLATELTDNNWSLKHIHRLIVNSSVYQQSSHVTHELLQRDPYNRLLARGARFRADAEIIRDITLTASGLLNPQIGGPPVRPPAPDFLFVPPASYGPKTWNEAEDSQRYRRGLYTFRFRSVPYPMLETFDAVPGNVSCVRRSRSNTPLQALTALNEPIALECAGALAARTMQEGGADDEQRMSFAFRCCVTRRPSETELQTLLSVLNRQRRRITTGELDAAAILHSCRQHDVPAEDQPELAAWALVARVLLSLDETMTRE